MLLHSAFPGWLPMAGLVTPGRVATGLGTLATLRPAQTQHGDNEMSPAPADDDNNTVEETFKTKLTPSRGLSP